MDTRTRRWLDCEQTVNERLASSESGARRIDIRDHTVAPRYRPEHRGFWPQEVVWLPRDRVRTYGPLDREVREAFGQLTPAGRVPFFLHPQAPASHRRLRNTPGSSLTDIWSTPTSSIRTVMARRGERPPVQLKLSLGAAVGPLRRSITEYYLVTGILVSHLLDTIPVSRRRRLGLDWFPERAGVVHSASGTGWMLRNFPAMMAQAGAGDLVPVFSLVAPRGGDPPLLVELIRRAGMRPEQFVIERILRPYVSVLGHLLLDEGLQMQGHAQNVLVEVDRVRGLTGRIVLRDLIDSSVNVALRLARGKPLARPGAGQLPRSTPFPLVRSAIDYRGSAGRRWPVAAADTVEGWGLKVFVWAVNTSLARYYKRYDAGRIEREYLHMWRDQVVRHLKVDPAVTHDPPGLATDEALTYFLSHFDWGRAGCVNGARLPAAAEALPHEGRLRRRPGPVYQRVESGWGDLYLDRGGPVFFRPAF